MTSNCNTHTHAPPPTHTQTSARASMRAHEDKRAAKITEKRPPDADEEQQQKGPNYTVKHITHVHVHKSAAEINELTVPR